MESYDNPSISGIAHLRDIGIKGNSSHAREVRQHLNIICSKEHVSFLEGGACNISHKHSLTCSFIQIYRLSIWVQIIDWLIFLVLDNNLTYAFYEIIPNISKVGSPWFWGHRGGNVINNCVLHILKQEVMILFYPWRLNKIKFCGLNPRTLLDPLTEQHKIPFTWINTTLRCYETFHRSKDDWL